MIPELSQVAPQLFLLIVAGGIAGFTAGLFGVGGGIVMVPTLYWVFGHYGLAKELAMAMAVATSLAVIIPTALSSTYSHYKLGNLDKRLSVSFIIPIVFGVLLGSHFIVEVKSQILFYVFAAITLLVAILLALPKKKLCSIPNHWLMKLGLGASLGCFSVVAGVGGGAIGTPMLMCMGRRSHIAVGTAASFGAMIAIPGVIAILFQGSTPDTAPIGTISLISLPAFLALATTSVLVAPIGAKVAVKLPALYLKRLLCIVLIVVGTRMLFSGLSL